MTIWDFKFCVPSIIGLERLRNQVLKLTNRRTLLYILSYPSRFRSLSLSFDTGALRHVQLTTTAVLFMSECFPSEEALYLPTFSHL